MRVGPGWDLVHLTDRVCELRKPDPLYYRFTDRPGYVRVRVEPGTPRADLIDQAVRLAQENDERLCELTSRLLMPALHTVAAHQGKQVLLKRAFAMPEDPEVIGAKRA